MAYQIKIEAGQAFDSKMKLRPTWNGSLIFVEADGSETPTGQRSSYWKSGDPSRRSTRGALLKALTSYRDHHARTGQRYELEQAAKRRQEKADKDARIARAKMLREAGPQMWKALNALYADFTSEHTHPSIRTGPHVALIAAALEAAGPQPDLEG